MSSFVRAVVVLLLAAPAAPAATPEQIEAAVAKGVASIKKRYGAGPVAGAAGTDHGIGPPALAGLALLEAKTPAADATVQAIAKGVREQAYRETRTYQISLALLFLDRLEDRADVPLVQALAVRLMAGQSTRGGWTYSAIDTVPDADVQKLRATVQTAELVTNRDGPQAGPRLHPAVQEYANALWAARNGARPMTDDNSNTQFAVLALWAARKHGVPVDAALHLIERRFLGTQDAQGGWPYSPDPGMGAAGTPAMTCAGLLAMATAIGRREEKRVKAEPPPKADPPPPGKANDPFFNPPPRPEGKGPAGPKRPMDARDHSAARGFGFLGAALANAARGGSGGEEVQNLYFLWSLERVGVIYGVDRIGGIDWYAAGADYLVRIQDADGAWSRGSYGADVLTPFAVLFLSKANLARDLSSRVRADPGGSELRAGSTAPVEAGPLPKGPVAPANPLPLPVAAPLPKGGPGKVASDLLAAANGPNWTKALEGARDAKGADHTTGLVATIHRLDGDKKRAARDALADRLSRMNAETLRGMMTNSDAELRRGAVLAAAMRDDKAHVPDLIERITDADELVVRAARAGLRSLTEQDFGPQPGATQTERTQAAAAWRNWWVRQKR
ncbi:HEAT repeat domain-containing protein [bacterium]|nr:HEAT repeat domain-containing protein [bacterium]